MEHRRTIFLSLLLTAAVASTPASLAWAQGKATHSFDIAAPFDPAPVSIDGRKLLRYELHLSSFTVAPLTVTRIEVVDAKTSRVVAAYEGEALAAAVRAVAAEAPGGSPPIVAAGRRSVAYFNLDVTDRQVPKALHHRITFIKRNETFVVTGGAVELDETPLPVLGPPLSGGPWTAIYLPEMDGGHRRFIYAVDGKARIPGRFAIDWMPAPGNPATCADVLAVADAQVVAAHDGVPQPVPGEPKKEVTAADEAGNYIILALPNGRYVHYQHMMPGLTVKAGDRVRRGQRLGRVGSTGQVTAPHLHLHVSDGTSLLGSEGQPFAMTGGTVIGNYPSLAAAEAVGPWQPVPPRWLGDLGHMLPPPFAVVRFDERGPR